MTKIVFLFNLSQEIGPKRDFDGTGFGKLCQKVGERHKVLYGKLFRALGEYGLGEEGG